VADSFSTYYRGHHKEIIVKGSGTDFDPKVIKAFIKAFRKGEMEVPYLVI